MPLNGKRVVISSATPSSAHSNKLPPSHQSEILRNGHNSVNHQLEMQAITVTQTGTTATANMDVIAPAGMTDATIQANLTAMLTAMGWTGGTITITDNVVEATAP